jgi:hypothetical protein
VKKVFADDLLHVAYLDEAVPYGLRIHHNDRAMLALVETSGVIRTNPMLQSCTLNSVLESGFEIFASAVRAAWPSGGLIPLVGADEEVFLEGRHNFVLFSSFTDCTFATRFCDNQSSMQSDNLISLKDDMVAFIAGHGLRRFNGYVTEEVPTVLFEEDNPDGWKDFVEHAKECKAAFITMSEVVLEKADIALLLEQLREQNFPDEDGPELDDAEYLINHVGKTGYLQLGFAQQGVMFLFETSTEWYERFQQLMESVTDLGSVIVDDRDSDE